MEQRATPKRNTNENRKRLRVSESPRYNKKYKQKMAIKKDRQIKFAISLLTLAILLGLTYFNIQKRNQLQAKRVEYNQLVSEVISTELKRDRLKAKLESSIDLNRIQRYAIESLGMSYADKNMMVAEDGGN